MYLPYNQNFITRSRNLRKDMTKVERKLWYCYLSKHPMRFLRQKIIDSYIVDFYCPKAKLVIELDGSQHYTEDGLKYDEHRTKVLMTYKLTVIRFANSEINNDFVNVCKVIDNKLAPFTERGILTPQSLRDSSLQ